MNRGGYVLGTPQRPFKGHSKPIPDRHHRCFRIGLRNRVFSATSPEWSTAAPAESGQQHGGERDGDEETRHHSETGTAFGRLGGPVLGGFRCRARSSFLDSGGCVADETHGVRNGPQRLTAPPLADNNVPSGVKAMASPCRS